MRKYSKLAAGSAILATAALATAGIALADGYSAKKGRVVYERPTDWSGVYFGIGSGYAWSNIDVAHVPSAQFPTGIGISSDHSDGIVTAHIGAQHQFGSIVLGIEGGWLSSIRDDDGSAEFCDSVVPVLANPIVAGGRNCRAKMNDILTLGARVGWAAGHWMPYATGGYANGGFDFTARGADIPFVPAVVGPPAVPAQAAVSNPIVEQAHARLHGWYIGGGVEWKVSPGWTAGVEYRHYDFGDNIVAAFSPGGTFRENVKFDATTDTVTARVTWKFGRPEVKPLK